jgi:hypothetical protein
MNMSVVVLWLTYMTVVVGAAVAVDVASRRSSGGKVRLIAISQLVGETVSRRLVRLRLAKTMLAFVAGLVLGDVGHEFMAAFLVAPMVAISAIGVLHAWSFARRIEQRDCALGRRGPWLVADGSLIDAGLWAWHGASPVPKATLV